MGFLKKKNKDESSSTNKKGGWFTNRETKSKTVQVTYVEKRGQEPADLHDGEDQTAIPHIGSQDLQVISTSDGAINVIRTSGDYDREIVNTEKEVQRQIKTIASSDSDVKLQTAGGVLIFDGLEAANSSDSGIKGDYDKGSNAEDSVRDRLNFVSAPKNFDPVASGFYQGSKAVKGGNKKFYDEDESNEETRESRIGDRA
mmetsp:Transcript_9802/g.14419  ORF Transcript_9802/g.14419 Transcript_9802/m.14419 type:complete len:200 (-) Transcript_9802:280-879(-)|eukprot:CAMPEP_0197241324 /NCGR_PEP_ID=MMETSP1429-20130617/7389_1 /TAXON_ID=49237 /ORGANISM="Chaetoceros  sp., Strain UNC1202" /LENGTH=199 /DNA_ID=CAMNT_0042701139 /DNA_START=61 /DNA_END=660 /DNA_ORIENTATION=+